MVNLSDPGPSSLPIFCRSFWLGFPSVIYSELSETSYLLNKVDTKNVPRMQLPSPRFPEDLLNHVNPNIEFNKIIYLPVR